MKIEFDDAKSARNVELRGLAFDLVAKFDFDSAQIITDERHLYGEVRYRAIGRLEDEIAAVVFTVRNDALRVISLRLASRKERRQYEKGKSKSGFG
jgi:uncharacterized DUF497 family protein